MTFKVKNLRPIGDNAATGVVPSIWLFFNADSDTVTTAGYIPASTGVKAKDMIAVIPAAGTSMAWYHATVSNGVITLASN